jgi:hypothetical protein
MQELPIKFLLLDERSMEQPAAAVPSQHASSRPAVAAKASKALIRQTQLQRQLCWLPCLLYLLSDTLLLQPTADESVTPTV